MGIMRTWPTETRCRSRVHWRPDGATAATPIAPTAARGQPARVIVLPAARPRELSRATAVPGLVPAPTIATVRHYSKE